MTIKMDKQMDAQQVISEIKHEQRELEREISGLIGKFCDKTGIKAFDMEIRLNGYSTGGAPIVNINSKI